MQVRGGGRRLTVLSFFSLFFSLFFLGGYKRGQSRDPANLNLGLTAYKGCDRGVIITLSETYLNNRTPPLRVEGNPMTEITTFVKHDDLILNVETRGPISGRYADRYVTKVWFGETEYSSPAVLNFHHTGKDVNVLHLLRTKVSDEPLEYVDKVHIDTRRETLTLP